MSRYSKKLGEQRIIYGFDNHLGYFFEVWEQETLDKFNKAGEHTDMKDLKPLQDRCSKFGMPKGTMLETLQEFGCNKRHISCVGLDQSF